MQGSKPQRDPDGFLLDISGRSCSSEVTVPAVAALLIVDDGQDQPTVPNSKVDLCHRSGEAVLSWRFIGTLGRPFFPIPSITSTDGLEWSIWQIWHGSLSEAPEPPTFPRET